jgi:hypothetical protein
MNSKMCIDDRAYSENNAQISNKKFPKFHDKNSSEILSHKMIINLLKTRHKPNLELTAFKYLNGSELCG